MSVSSRVSRYGSNFRFFNVFIIRQAPLIYPKQANFCRSLQNSRAEIQLCAKFVALRCDKTIQDSGLIFCSKVSKSKFFKKPKDVFSYKNPFDSYLIMKDWNPRKWPTLVSSPG